MQQPNISQHFCHSKEQSEGNILVVFYCNARDMRYFSETCLVSIISLDPFSSSPVLFCVEASSKVDWNHPS